MANTLSLSALTRDKFIPVLVDNIFNSNILCYKLLKNAEMLDGGKKIVTPVENVVSTNQGWIASGGATAQASVDTFHKAEWDWATAYNGIILEGDIEHMNQGSSQVLSMLKAKLKNAEKSIKDMFGTALFNSSLTSNGITTLNGAGTFNGTSVLSDVQAHDNGNGLIHDFSAGSGTSHYIPVSTVAGSVIGYDQALGGITSTTGGDHDYWNSNLGTFEWAIGTVGGASGGTALASNGSNDTGAVSFANFCSTTSGVAGGVKAMTQMYGACTVDADAPDLIVTTQVIYDAYESALQANKRYEGDSTLGDAGFQSLRFKGASVVVDSHVPDGHMYFLNTNYLDFKTHSKRNFAFEDFKRLEASDKIQARIFWMGQLVCTNPRMQGLLVGGPTGY